MLFRSKGDSVEEKSIRRQIQYEDWRMNEKLKKDIEEVKECTFHPRITKYPLQFDTPNTGMHKLITIEECLMLNSTSKISTNDILDDVEIDSLKVPVAKIRKKPRFVCMLRNIDKIKSNSNNQKGENTIKSGNQLEKNRFISEKYNEKTRNIHNKYNTMGII